MWTYLSWNEIRRDKRSLMTESLSVMCQVQEPPSWVIKPADLEGVESEKVEFQCQALGSPLPTYSWVDSEGISVTEREGQKILWNRY